MPASTSVRLEHVGTFAVQPVRCETSGLEMTPFLVDVIQALLTMESKTNATSLWVLRVLACTVQRLALMICEDRWQAAGSLNPPASNVPGPKEEAQPFAATAVSAFFGGELRSWKLPRRRDGFFLQDLGMCLDEDAEESDEEPSQTRCNANGRYHHERCIASSVIMWARNFLQSSVPVSRHLAHVATIHGLTVLSTRVKELLPNVHNVWQHITPSFSDGVGLATLADSCILLKHMARLSGDFIQRRFLNECWPGIWKRLSSAVPVQNCSKFSPELKMQRAALDAIVFLSGDSSLVRGVSQPLVILAIKYAGPSTAESLRCLAWSLLERMATMDPDLLWIYIQALEQPRESFDLNWQGQMLDLAAAGWLAEDVARLKEMVDLEDSQPWQPRVALGVGGCLWSAELASTHEDPEKVEDVFVLRSIWSSTSLMIAACRCFYISKAELTFLEVLTRVGRWFKLQTAAENDRQLSQSQDREPAATT